MDVTQLLAVLKLVNTLAGAPEGASVGARLLLTSVGDPVQVGQAKLRQ